MHFSAVSCLPHQGATLPGPGLLWVPWGLGHRQAQVRCNQAPMLLA